jgi:hypothetical protein
VSIVNWKKGQEPGPKVLYTENPDKTLSAQIVPHINSSLSLQIDLAGAQVLSCNTSPKCVFQGQTHGHEGFLLEKVDGLKILKSHPEYAEVLRPFLIGDELLSNLGGQPGRYVIDFTEKDIIEASSFRELYKIVEAKVLPDKKTKAEAQDAENRVALEKNSKAKVNKHHINFYNSWWKLVWGRREMLQAIRQLPRYIACSRVTKRPIFEFISSEIQPNDALMVFTLDDDYSFGIISSGLHFLWFKEKCSTMKGDFRYTTESVWDTFPWPQQPSEVQILAVGKAAKALRDLRHDYMSRGHLNLRDLYRTLDKPGKNPLRDAQEALDRAVLAAYGWPELSPSDMGGILQRLLDLNAAVAAAGTMATKPGVAAHLRAGLVSEDCVRVE